MHDGSAAVWADEAGGALQCTHDVNGCNAKMNLYSIIGEEIRSDGQQEILI